MKVKGRGECRGKVNKLEDYLMFLKSKGFLLGDDAIGFIYFGRAYTNASDEITILAIEYTLKLQQSFDGSFFVSLLETFVQHKLTSKKEVIHYMKINTLFPL